MSPSSTLLSIVAVPPLLAAALAPIAFAPLSSAAYVVVELSLLSTSAELPAPFAAAEP
jgi:hypothetical protein